MNIKFYFLLLLNTVSIQRTPKEVFHSNRKPQLHPFIMKYIYRDDLINVKNCVNIQEIIQDIATSATGECPFFTCDINDIINKYQLWKRVLPLVEPHFAVKCNNSPTVLRVLAALGLGFDCASKSEIQQVLSHGVDPSRIIFAHPIKCPTHIQYAAEKKVDLMTFDNEMELHKIKKNFQQARTVIRIKYDSNAKAVFGLKYGCDPYIDAENLLKVALDLNITVVGVSFHIGFGAKDPSAFYYAIKAAHHVFRLATALGHNFNLLDIGGGFPGERSDALCAFAEFINLAIDEYFPDRKVRVISEPGNYFVRSAFTLACCIHSVKEKVCNISEFGTSHQYIYYINDGVFGNLSGIISYKLELIPRSLIKYSGEKKYPSILWGPTLDVTDKVHENVLLPKMNLGDWVIFDDMGSYVSVKTTEFNGFGSSSIYNIINKENWSLLSNKWPFHPKNFNRQDEKNLENSAE